LEPHVFCFGFGHPHQAEVHKVVVLNNLHDFFHSHYPLLLLLFLVRRLELFFVSRIKQFILYYVRMLSEVKSILFFGNGKFLFIFIFFFLVCRADFIFKEVSLESLYLRISRFEYRKETK